MTFLCSRFNCGFGGNVWYHFLPSSSAFKMPKNAMDRLPHQYHVFLLLQMGSLLFLPSWRTLLTSAMQASHLTGTWQSRCSPTAPLSCSMSGKVLCGGIGGAVGTVWVYSVTLGVGLLLLHAMTSVLVFSTGERLAHFAELDSNLNVSAS